MSLKNTLLFSLLYLLPFVIQGQDISRESLLEDIYTLNPEKKGTVEISLDNLSFFKNNETDGDILRGYTLPGVRLNPHIIYYLAKTVKLEAGFSLLKYWGTNKYPNHAYSDIADWKANDYQTGFHFLPTFRAQIEPIPQLNIVMGNLYGGSNHRLIEPLYYSELNLTADPECGVQFLFDLKNFHLDAWLDWESFIFRNDTHNEAFTFGISSYFRVLNPQSPYYLEVPVQALVMHRGGEIDCLSNGITSQANAYTGLRCGFYHAHNLLSKVEINILGGGFTSSTTKPYPLPFTRGWAFYSDLKAWIKNFQLQMGLWRSSNFINILGNPIFGNISTEIPNRTFPQVTVIQPSIKYEQKIEKSVYLGTNFDFYYTPRLVAYENTSDPVKISNSTSFAFGLYLRINPSIVLKNGIH